MSPIMINLAHDKIADTIIFVFVCSLAAIIRGLHELHKTGKIQILKRLTSRAMGIIMAGLLVVFYPEGYTILWMDETKSGIAIAFFIGFFGDGLIGFILSKDISYFISLITKTHLGK